MSRKLLFFSGITSAFLSTSAFKIQTPVWNGPENWAALFVVFVLIIFLAILLIYQRSLTPSNTAYYHIDRAEHDLGGVHGVDEHTGIEPEQHPASTARETPTDADGPQEE
jgi:hypothetical protein